MTVFRFGFPTGYTPILEVFNAVTRASLGTGEAVEYGTSGEYAAIVDTGIFQGNVFAQTDSPEAKFYGNAGDGQLYDDPSVWLLQSIKQKTSAIGSGVITLAVPVSGQGQFSKPLVIGDDYLAANGRAISWTIDRPDGVTVGAATCQLGFFHPQLGSFQVSGTITAEDNDKIKISFDIPRDASESLKPGEYDWSAQVNSDTGAEMTQVHQSERRKVCWINKSVI